MYHKCVLPVPDIKENTRIGSPKFTVSLESENGHVDSQIYKRNFIYIVGAPI